MLQVGWSTSARTTRHADLKQPLDMQIFATIVSDAYLAQDTREPFLVAIAW